MTRSWKLGLTCGKQLVIKYSNDMRYSNSTDSVIVIQRNPEETIKHTADMWTKNLSYIW